MLRSQFKREGLAGLVGLSVILLAIGGIVYLWYIDYLRIPETASLLAVGNVVGSLVLSSLLVILYFMVYSVQRRQEGIQEQQADIMEKQEELMAAEHQPIIEPDGDRASGSVNTLTIPISNFGNGLAKNLSVRYNVAIQKPDSDADLSPTDQRLTRQSAGLNSIASGKESQGSKLQPRHIIYADETGVPFKSNFPIKVPDIEQEHWSTRSPFQMAMAQLAALDVEEIRFQVYLQYEDITGRASEEPVLGRSSVKIDENLTVTEALERGNRTAPAGRVRVRMPSGLQRVKWELRQLWNRFSSDGE